MNRVRCVECEGYNTVQVDTEWMTDMLEVVRVCKDCDAQYTNQYSLVDKLQD